MIVKLLEILRNPIVAYPYWFDPWDFVAANKPASKPQAYRDEDEGEIQTIADFLQDNQNVQRSMLYFSNIQVSRLNIKLVSFTSKRSIQNSF